MHKATKLNWPPTVHSRILKQVIVQYNEVQEQQVEVNEMRMLRLMCGVIRKDNVRNKQASKYITERRLN